MNRLFEYFSTVVPRPVLPLIILRYYRFLNEKLPTDDDNDKKAIEFMTNNTWLTGIDALVRALSVKVKVDLKKSFNIDNPPNTTAFNVNVLNKLIIDIFDTEGLAILRPRSTIAKQLVLELVNPFTHFTFLSFLPFPFRVGPG